MLVETAISSEIYEAAYKGDLAKVKALIAKDPTAVNEKEAKGGNSALHGSIFGGHFEIAEFLIANKADINARTKYDVTPLHSAVRRKNKELVELLLKSGADVNAKDVQQGTPLWSGVLAHSPGMDEIIALLMEYKADPKIKTERGQTALDLAKKKNLTKALELMQKQKK